MKKTRNVLLTILLVTMLSSCSESVSEELITEMNKYSSEFNEYSAYFNELDDFYTDNNKIVEISKKVNEYTSLYKEYESINKENFNNAELEYFETENNSIKTQVQLLNDIKIEDYYVTANEINFEKLEFDELEIIVPDYANVEVNENDVTMCNIDLYNGVLTYSILENNPKGILESGISTRKEYLLGAKNDIEDITKENFDEKATKLSIVATSNNNDNIQMISEVEYILTNSKLYRIWFYYPTSFSSNEKAIVDKIKESIKLDNDKLLEYVKDQTETNTSSSNGIDPSFKKMMDEYEAFFDEYVAFMNNYSSNNNPLALLGDYMKFLSKFSTYMSALESVDQDELNEAELSYYLEVSARISKKLLNVIS